jgi:PAS domain S-box-containing protein
MNYEELTREELIKALIAKENELKLSINEEQKKAILNGISANIAFVDKDLKILWANKTAANSVSKSPNDMIGNTCHHFWADPSKPCDNCPSIKAFETQKSQQIIMHTPDGRVWSESGEPIFDTQGNLIGVVEIATDITDRIRAEEALHDSEEKHRILFQNSPDAYLIIVDGIFIDCNRAAEIMLGGEKAQIIGITPENISPEFQPDGKTSKESAEEKIAFAFKTGFNSFEWLHRRFDGSDFVVEVSIASMFLDGKEALFTTWRDITDRIKAEKTLKIKNEELQRLNSEKDKFFSIIAHDLKSPFLGFLGLTELMAENISNFSNEQLVLFGGNIHQSANNLFRLLKNLLEWAQMQRGSMPFEPKVTLLSDIVFENIDVIKKNSERKGVEIINNAKRPLLVWVDEKMVNSVFLNLLSNAVKFTQKGDKIIIDVTDFENGMVEVSVSDTGVGMDEDYSSRLFVLGEKIGTKGTGGELSTGLGLLLCKEFVEKNGGTIRVESKKGFGSSFIFTLNKYKEE